MLLQTTNKFILKIGSGPLSLLAKLY